VGQSEESLPQNPAETDPVHPSRSVEHGSEDSGRTAHRRPTLLRGGLSSLLDGLGELGIGCGALNDAARIRRSMVTSPAIATG
jgi:hypothetical protein